MWDMADVAPLIEQAVMDAMVATIPARPVAAQD
jgi:hypothetical protein